jgi:hypothetical protein
MVAKKTLPLFRLTIHVPWEAREVEFHALSSRDAKKRLFAHLRNDDEYFADEYGVRDDCRENPWTLERVVWVASSGWEGVE